jgi:hypothetical protein
MVTRGLALMSLLATVRGWRVGRPGKVTCGDGPPRLQAKQEPRTLKVPSLHQRQLPFVVCYPAIRLEMTQVRSQDEPGGKHSVGKDGPVMRLRPEVCLLL